MTKVAKWSIGIGAGLVCFDQCIYDGRTVSVVSSHILVDGGERAVIFDRFRGVLPKTIKEGTHFKIPFIQVEKGREA